MFDDFFKVCVFFNEKKKNEFKFFFWIVYSLLFVDKILKKYLVVMYIDDVLY